MLKTLTFSTIGLLATATLPMESVAAKTTETVIYSFAGTGDGYYPWATLISDSTGNLFGTTHHGGACAQINTGCGTVFKVTPGGKHTVLYVFQGGSDGADPYSAPVALGADGNLYGTTRLGGVDCDGTGQGCGTVFKLTPRGKETVLHSFTGGSDGSHADAGMIFDANGNLYGTTNFGGTDCDGTGQGCGTVFTLSPKGEERILYAFKGGDAGAHTVAGLIMDEAGNLYGANHGGGIDCDGTGFGCGAVFRLSPTGKEKVLHVFAGGTDGANPYAAPVMDSQGFLYGTTNAGGNDSNFGIVYRISPKGKEKVLHTFTGDDGANPYDPLIFDGTGNLYGTASFGGTIGAGAVFRLNPRGSLKVLYSFADSPDGAIPLGGLVMDGTGNLFGTTIGGGTNSEHGTIFRIGN